MRTIHKYKLQVCDVQDIALPCNAKILCIQVQNGKPCIWAEISTEEPLEVRTVHIYGTGHKMTESNYLSYIGTFQLHDGALVFHAYLQTN